MHACELAKIEWIDVNSEAKIITLKHPVKGHKCIQNTMVYINLEQALFKTERQVPRKSRPQH